MRGGFGSCCLSLNCRIFVFVKGGVTALPLHPPLPISSRLPRQPVIHPVCELNERNEACCPYLHTLSHTHTHACTSHTNARRHTSSHPMTNQAPLASTNTSPPFTPIRGPVCVSVCVRVCALHLFVCVCVCV